jgi:cell division septation protein DedD
MKFSLAVALAAATSYVSAQDLSSIPSCALSCLVPAVSSVGCSPTDFKCSCGKSSQLNAAAAPCIQSACSASDQTKANTALEDICSKAGVPITLPPVGGASTPASSPAASSPAASSPAASTPAASSPAASSPAASSPAGYGATATSASAPKPTNATTSVVPYTGGAGQTGISFGAAIAVLAGALYAL